MRKLFTVLVIGLLLSGCTSSTRYGSCIGVFDDRDPKLTYSTSGWNVGIAILFFGLIIPPAVVIANETLCPSGTK
jgi:hypothetical protein